MAKRLEAPEILSDNELKAACMVLAVLLPNDRREPVAAIIERIIQYARRKAVEDYKASQRG